MIKIKNIKKYNELEEEDLIYRLIKICFNLNPDINITIDFSVNSFSLIINEKEFKFIFNEEEEIYDYPDEFNYNELNLNNLDHGDLDYFEKEKIKNEKLKNLILKCIKLKIEEDYNS